MNVLNKYTGKCHCEPKRSKPKRFLASSGMAVIAWTASCYRLRNSHTLLLFAIVIAPIVLFILQGCSTIQRLIAPRPDPRLAPMRAEVLNFADMFFDKVDDTTYKVATLAGTPQARVDTTLWRIHYCTNAIQIATGPNPKANLIDMVTMASLARMAMENDAIERLLGIHTQILRNTFRRMEQEGWEIARRYLTREQLSDLRRYIRECHERYPNSILVGNVRLAEYANIRTKSGKKTNVGSELIGILIFDPFSGLDPAVREVEALRDFADRSMFQLERFPIIMRWQMEMLYSRILQAPESHGLFKDISRVSESTERFSQAVAMLPDHLTKEREGFFRDLDTEMSRITSLLGQLEQTATYVRKEGDALVTKLFRTGVLLIVVFFVGLVISLVVYRLISQRILPASKQ
ncbi:MAG: hypothetical protein E3K40_02575 [Candidatus Brocadia sp.]|nr:hypothetical protein [Candidatus Brocadia sp.]